MRPEKMPGYCAPRVWSELTTETTTISTNLAMGESVDQFFAPLLASLVINWSGVHKFCFETVHILTGLLTEA